SSQLPDRPLHASLNFVCPIPKPRYQPGISWDSATPGSARSETSAIARKALVDKLMHVSFVGLRDSQIMRQGSQFAVQYHFVSPGGRVLKRLCVQKYCSGI